MPRELSFSLGIGPTPLTEPEDPEMANELFRIYQALNVLALQLDTVSGSLTASSSDRPYIIPSTANREQYVSRAYAKATVALTAGELVHINSSGFAVKAQATTTHLLKAQAVVLETTAINGYAPIALRGVVKLYAALTPGAEYFLSTVAGAISAAQPAATNTLQYIGFALSPSELYVCPELRHSVV